MWAILVAAGSGRRMGSQLPKQYLPLAGKTLLERSLETLDAARAVSAIAVVIAPDDKHWKALDLSTSKPLRVVKGGRERVDSVMAGLRSIENEAAAEDWVLVHDAARVCLQPEQIDQMESALMGHPCGGLLATPVKDTLKLAEGDEVTNTLDRDRLWQAQTPQVFRYELLVQALQSSVARGIRVTDESMAMEKAGHRPRLISSSAENIKITVPEDLAYAEFILSRRKQVKSDER